MTSAKPKVETKEDPAPTPEEVAVQEQAAADAVSEDAPVVEPDAEASEPVEPPPAPEPVPLDENNDAESVAGRPRLVALRNAPAHDAEEVALPVGGQVATGDVWAEIIVAGAVTPTFQLLAKEGIVVHPGDVAGLPARG